MGRYWADAKMERSGLDVSDWYGVFQSESAALAYIEDLTDPTREE